MSARSKFKASRDAFYLDLAEAIAAGESLFVFLARRQEFCIEQGQKALAEIYGDMIARMDDHTELAEIVGEAVPAEDALSLATVEKQKDDVERARVLRDLAASIRRRNGIRKILVKAVQGPMLAVPAMILLPLLVSFQLPLFDELLPHAEWGTLLEAFWWVCYVIREYWFVLAALAIGGGVWFARSFRNWCSPLRYKLDNHLPYSLYRDLAAAGFLNAMAEYMTNKTPMIAALEDLESRSSPWMAERIAFMLNWLDDHPGEYAEAFDSGLLSPELHLRLVAYAERGNARVSGSNDAFANGLVQLGTDGMNHVTEKVEKGSGYVTLASTIAVVVVLFVFYGGFNSVSNMVSDHYEQEAEEAAATVGPAR
jgi:hypothetical protein